jgi:hypothetical protein
MDMRNKSAPFTFGPEWDCLTNEDRIARIQSMADEASRMSDVAGDEELRRAYGALSRQWLLLLQELRRNAEEKS